MEKAAQVNLLLKRSLQGAGVLTAWELLWWLVRYRRRGVFYADAKAAALRLNRPLVVIGAPDGGVTAGYGCGDVTLDIVPSMCPVSRIQDITQPLPFEDNSVVVYVSCTLEYVKTDKINDVMAELQRVSGGQVWVVRVEPWTLSGWFYPGTQRRLPADIRPALTA